MIRDWHVQRDSANSAMLCESPPVSLPAWSVSGLLLDEGDHARRCLLGRKMAEHAPAQTTLESGGCLRPLSPLSLPRISSLPPGHPLQRASLENGQARVFGRLCSVGHLPSYEKKTATYGFCKAIYTIIPVQLSGPRMPCNTMRSVDISAHTSGRRQPDGPRSRNINAP